jgi:hypothetical protein
MAAKFTTLTHKIAIQLHLVAERCTVCRRPVRNLLDTPSYIKLTQPNILVYSICDTKLFGNLYESVCLRKRQKTYMADTFRSLVIEQKVHGVKKFQVPISISWPNTEPCASEVACFILSTSGDSLHEPQWLRIAAVVEMLPFNVNAPKQCAWKRSRWSGRQESDCFTTTARRDSIKKMGSTIRRWLSRRTCGLFEIFNTGCIKARTNLKTYWIYSCVPGSMIQNQNNETLAVTSESNN